VHIIPLALLAALFALPPLASIAQMPGAGGTAPGVDCRAAAVAFEQSAKLPPGLLLAIGQVESGRADATTGEINPWPWATNNAGEGHFFASPQEAIAWVAAEQAVGNQSIDVGCFQVNLHYHPDAFASLADAFDPSANARYAANLLNRLHDQSGSWPLAIALYHSAEPFEGQRYGARVLAAWNSGGKILGLPYTASVDTTDPVVVRLAAAASVVRVELPTWAVAQSVGLYQPRLKPTSLVMAGPGPAIDYPHQFANDAIPVSNHPMEMAGRARVEPSDDVVGPLRAVPQQLGRLILLAPRRSGLPRVFTPGH
jgi:Transglycosylase SLT domain